MSVVRKDYLGFLLNVHREGEDINHPAPHRLSLRFAHRAVSMFAVVLLANSEGFAAAPPLPWGGHAPAYGTYFTYGGIERDFPPVRRQVHPQGEFANPNLLVEAPVYDLEFQCKSIHQADPNVLNRKLDVWVESVRYPGRPVQQFYDRSRPNFGNSVAITVADAGIAQPILDILLVALFTESRMDANGVMNISITKPDMQTLSDPFAHDNGSVLAGEILASGTSSTGYFMRGRVSFNGNATPLIGNPYTGQLPSEKDVWVYQNANGTNTSVFHLQGIECKNGFFRQEFEVSNQFVAGPSGLVGVLQSNTYKIEGPNATQLHQDGPHPYPVR